MRKKIDEIEKSNKILMYMYFLRPNGPLFLKFLFVLRKIRKAFGKISSFRKRIEAFPFPFLKIRIAFRKVRIAFLKIRIAFGKIRRYFSK